MTGAAAMARRTVWVAGLLMVAGGLAVVGYLWFSPGDERGATPAPAASTQSDSSDIATADAPDGGEVEAGAPAEAGAEPARSAPETPEAESPAPETAASGTESNEIAETDETTGAAPEAPIPAPRTAARTPGDASSAKAPPSFDIVRVERTGEAVIAGRAMPGSEVTILRDGEPVARVKADRRGEFVAIPDEPLPPGRGHLTLNARDGQGRESESEEAVVLAIPPSEAGASDGQGDAGEQEGGTVADAGSTRGGGGAMDDPGDRPLALLVPRAGDGEVRVLQEPHPDEGLDDGRLQLESIQYTEDGRIRIRGMGAPGDRIVLYLNGEKIGGSPVDGEGRWRIVPRVDVPPGLHTLRIEELSPGGRLVARLETPFSSQPLIASLVREDLVVVQPGSNLWTIARRTYGGGRHYDLIYKANTDQIDDPDLIYPGQVFVLPQRPAGLSE